MPEETAALVREPLGNTAASRGRRYCDLRLDRNELLSANSSVIDLPGSAAGGRHGRLRAVFGEDAIIDDLEDEQDTREDAAEYVRLRLAASPRHRNNPIGIAAVAERVALRADRVFLYARIV